MSIAPPIERTTTLPWRLCLGAAGVAIVLGGWEVLGRRGSLGISWPPLSTVVRVGFDQRSLLWGALKVTLPEAGLGLVFGSGAAVLLALLPVVVPVARRTTHRTAAILNAVPLVVLAPVLVTLLGSERVPIVIASFSSFFATFVSTSSGFDTTSRAYLDVVSTLGGNRWMSFRYIRLPGGLPSLADGLQLAAPGAVLGAVFGQWFGAQEGLGVILVTAMQNLEVPLLWAAALLATLLSGAALIVFSALQRLTRSRFW